METLNFSSSQECKPKVIIPLGEQSPKIKYQTKQ